jgi:hypothetical protein
MATNRFLTLVNGVYNLVTGISTSAGVADADKLVATGSDGRLSSTLLPSGIGAATESIIAFENLAAGDFVNIYDNAGSRNVRKADASNGRLANGFVLSAFTAASTAIVYTDGANTALTGLTPGARMFLSSLGAGTTTSTAPTTIGHIIQPLGFAVSTTAIAFNSDAPIVIG